VPKVSIIIPVYNVEPYLRRCLESVVNQTLKDIEIICINDASTDNSLLILKEYASKDNRVKIIDFKENKGVAAARNKGMEISTGEYVAFVDPDDYVDLDFYETLYANAQHSGADLSKGNLRQLIGDSVRVFGEVNNEIRMNKLRFTYTFTSVIYSRALLEKHNITFIEDCSFSEDKVFAIQTAYFANKIEVSDCTYYNYISRGGSATLYINKRKACDHFYAAESALDFLNSVEINKKDYARIFDEFLWCALKLLFWNPDKESERIALEGAAGLLEKTGLAADYPEIYEYCKNIDVEGIREYFSKNGTKYFSPNGGPNERQNTPKRLSAPLLYIFFNRKEYIEKTFEQIKRARPAYLYLCSDGARTFEEEKVVNEIRKYVLNGINWNCQVRTLFREENWGCDNNIVDALVWFFKNEEKGIIVEDDCLANQSFFDFCEIMLEKYEHNEKISYISGCNRGTDFGNSTPYDYIFTPASSIWGWAAWRRSFEGFDSSMPGYEQFRDSGRIKEAIVHPDEENFYTTIMNDAYNTRLRWDFAFCYLNLRHGRYSIVPVKNLVENIGVKGGQTFNLKNSDLKSLTGSTQDLDCSSLNHPPGVHFDKNLYNILVEHKFRNYPLPEFRKEVFNH